jgi:hypothetical protein
VELNQAVRSPSDQFLSRSNLPPKASDDAVHIAAATVHGLDYLLTWNCKHIANAQIQRKLAQISLDFGYQLYHVRLISYDSHIDCTPPRLRQGCFIFESKISNPIFSFLDNEYLIKIQRDFKVSTFFLFRMKQPCPACGEGT